MSTPTLFPVQHTSTLLDALVAHGFHLAALRELGHGMALWLSRDSAYSVEVAVQESEPVAPYSITILQNPSLDDAERWAGDPDDFITMASCELGADFAMRSAQFQHGMVADHDGFVVYLKMVLDDIGVEPVLTSDFDVSDDMETGLATATEGEDALV
jgi:hypothetical protein